MVRLSITLGVIPRRTGRNIRGIPPSAGLARGAYSPKQIRKSTIGRTITKASKPSWLIKVEKDTSLDDEIKDYKEV